MKILDLESNRYSFNVIEVLPSLKGLPVNDIVKSYLHALRPSRIEIINFGEGYHSNAVNWRVRIFLDNNGKISEISQEVQVGLYGDIEHGQGLIERLKKSK